MCSLYNTINSKKSANKIRSHKKEFIIKIISVNSKIQIAHVNEKQKNLKMNWNNWYRAEI